MTRTLSVQEFFEMFPDDDTCLEHLMRNRFGDALDCPKCGKTGKFHRIRRHPAYECAWCGHEIYPMVGTPFARSHTPLQKWFYAIYLFATTRHGVSAKELQRQLSVSYKTAWRMGHEIRKHMAKLDGDPPLTGHVEADETYVGGYERGAVAGKGKTVVFGMVQRNGPVYTKVVPNARAATLVPEIKRRVPPGTRISTDSNQVYARLGADYAHATVNHEAEEWVRGDTHVNSIEGFWSIIKRSIKGTHVHVSPKHLPKYLGEFEYRYNLRKFPDLILSRLLSAF